MKMMICVNSAGSEHDSGMLSGAATAIAQDCLVALAYEHCFPPISPSLQELGELQY